MNTSLLTSGRQRAQTALLTFFTAPASARPLAVFRIGLAAVLLVQAYTLSGSLLDLFGNRGIVQWPIMDSSSMPGTPRLAWAVELFARFGIGDEAVVRSTFLIYVAGLAALLVGFQTRSAAVIVWFTHTMFKTSGTAVVYGVDTFAHIMLFYCIVMPVGHALSLDVAQGRVKGGPSSAARLSLRLLQIHLCIVYFASGIEKSLGADWWDGEAIWCALMRRDLCMWDMSWLANIPLIPKILGWGTLVLEIGYPLMVWSRKTRLFWGLQIVALHVGIAIMMSLVSFAAVMIVLTTSAFLVSAAPVAVAVVQPRPSRSKVESPSMALA